MGFKVLNTCLNIGKSSSRVMAKTAYHVTGITVIVRVTAERRVETELAALLGCTDVLINRVNRLKNTTREFLELAKLHGFVDAMILKVVEALRCLESIRAGNGQSIHVRELALLR